MKIAVCIAGQPRAFEEGAKNIFTLVENNLDCDFDFYCHAWWDGDEVGNPYKDVGPWSNTKNELVEKDIDKKIIKIYNPKKFKIEPSKNFKEITKKIKKTKPFQDYIKTLGKLQKKYKLNSVEAMVSQLYSRNKVLNLLYDCKKEYDFVIFTRYDCIDETTNSFKDSDFRMRQMKFDTMNVKKTYIVRSLDRLSCSRLFIFTDQFMCMSFDKIKIFDAFENIFDLIIRNENPNMGPEELLTTNYLKYFNNFDDVVRLPYHTIWNDTLKSSESNNIKGDY